MILLQLFASFLKIGAFTFGGGYAMIPLIEQDIIVAHGWLTMAEFVDLIAVAEMTPGPIAINCATFVGYRIAGIGGAVVCTSAIVLPPFAIVLIISSVFLQFRNSHIVQLIMEGIRPTVVALVLSAAFSVGKASGVDLVGIVLSVAVFWGVVKKQYHPILLIVLAGMVGVLLNIAGIW
jgi:chromate transporter